MFLKIVSLYLVGAQNHVKFLPKFPAKNQENFADELLQARRENNVIAYIKLVCKFIRR